MSGPRSKPAAKTRTDPGTPNPLMSEGRSRRRREQIRLHRDRIPHAPRPARDRPYRVHRRSRIGTRRSTKHSATDGRGPEPPSAREGIPRFTLVTDHIPRTAAREERETRFQSTILRSIAIGGGPLRPSPPRMPDHPRKSWRCATCPDRCPYSPACSWQPGGPDTEYSSHDSWSDCGLNGIAGASRVMSDAIR